MFANSSIMGDKDNTFFGDQSFMDKHEKNNKDCTKNSSNPEKVYKE